MYNYPPTQKADPGDVHNKLVLRDLPPYTAEQQRIQRIVDAIGSRSVEATVQVQS